MVATISSRTPEGVPHRCPICLSSVCLEPSLSERDAPCPACGHLLWFGDRTEPSGRSARPRVRKKTLRTGLEPQSLFAAFALLRLMRPPGANPLWHWFQGVSLRIRRRAPAHVPAAPVRATPGIWDPWLDGLP